MIKKQKLAHSLDSKAASLIDEEHRKIVVLRRFGTLPFFNEENFIWTLGTALYGQISLCGKNTHQSLSS